MICSSSQSDRWKGTQVLHHLLATGYKLSWKKTQTYQKVHYLGFDLEKSLRLLGPEGKEVIPSIPRPENKRQLRKFLSTAGFCQIGIKQVLSAAPAVGTPMRVGSFTHWFMKEDS